MKAWRPILIAALALLAAGPLVAPRLLAFPYSEQIGADRIWATAPISRPALERALAEANARVGSSALAQGAEGRDIYLTDGGWRWLWLANTAHDAFALTRSINEAVVVNRTDLTEGIVVSPANGNRTRTLAAIIAHEKCHGVLRRHFGMMVDFQAPLWLREGYCDHLARESTLTDAEAARLLAEHRSHPALPYYLGHKRVEAALVANGNNIDRLFDEAR